MAATSSWVIKEKGTGAIVMETFQKKVVTALNPEKYEAVPIQEHLAGLNKALRAGELDAVSLQPRCIGNPVPGSQHVVEPEHLKESY